MKYSVWFDLDAEGEIEVEAESPEEAEEMVSEMEYARLLELCDIPNVSCEAIEAKQEGGAE